jgi:hypothetical protein
MESGRTASYKYDEYNYPAAVFSSNFKVNLVPENEGWEAVLRLLKGKEWQRISGTNAFVVDCAARDSFEDISFMLDGKWLQLKAQDYILEVDGACILGLIPTEQNMWIFGTSAM